MLIEFSVKNFRSIKEELCISFEASDDETLEEYCVLKPELEWPGDTPLRLLKLNIIYGANASGKTNLIEALRVLNYLVNQKKDDKEEAISFIYPFIFDNSFNDKPSQFKISFVSNKIIYHYEVATTTTHIVKEKLSYLKGNTSQLIFDRSTNEGQKITEINFDSVVDDDVQQAIQLNTLWNSTVISAFQRLNVKCLSLDNVVDWFRKVLMRRVMPSTENLDKFISDEIQKNNINQKNVIYFMKKADFYIKDFEWKEEKIPEKHWDIISELIGNTIQSLAEINGDKISKLNKEEIQQGLQKGNKKLFFVHTVNGQDFSLDFNSESSGTQRYYGLCGLLDYVSSNNKLLPIDELESSLHPDLIVYFLRCYLTIDHHSQMLITTHYREFLQREDLYRKDMIWFMKRNKDSASEIYSLFDFNENAIPEKSSVYGAYRIGRLGAVPEIID